MKKVILVMFDARINLDSSDLQRTQYNDYAYFTDIEGLQPLDKVVVNAKDGVTVATVSQVTGIELSQSKKAAKWVVCKVDMKGFYARMEKERLIQEVRNQIHRRKSEMEEMFLLKTLAKEDPALRELLEKLGTLDPDAVPAGLLGKQ